MEDKEQNQVQKSGQGNPIGNEVKETANQGSEALKAGANAASGNWIGAAKNGLNLLKSKSFRRKAIITALMNVGVPIIIIVFVCVTIFSIGVTIKDTLIQLGSKVSTGLSEMWQWITNDYWIDLSEGQEYFINAETGKTLGTEEELKEAGKWIDNNTAMDEEGNTISIEKRKYTIVENYIKDLGNQGISISDLRLLGDSSDGKNFDELMADTENKELVEKYISEFIRADIITQQFHKTRGTNVIATDGHGHENINKVDGGIYLYRTTRQESIDESKFESGNYAENNVKVDNGSYRQMEYVDIEEFQQMIENNNPDVRYKFSIDKETDELLVAKITETRVVESDNSELSGIIGQWFSGLREWLADKNMAGQVTYEMETTRLPYKDYVSKYAMPFEFLITLCEITQNPEFVYHVALLARNTQIVLAIQDDTTIVRTTIEKEEDKQDYKNSSPSTAGAEISNQRTEKTRTVKTVTTQEPQLLVEYADTWSFYEEFEYTKNISGTLEEDEEPIVGPGNVRDTLSGYNEGGEVQVGEYLNGDPIMEEQPEYWYDTFTTQTRTKTQVIHTTTTYNPATIKNSVEKSKQFLGLLRNSTGECPYDCYEKNTWDNAKYCAEEAVFDEEGINVSYKIPNMDRYEMPLNKLESGLEMLYALLQSNTSGYSEEDKLVNNIDDAYNVQQDYLTEEDYESAYVVEMQGIVEHIRYLMTFPPNEIYTVKDLLLEGIGEVIDDIEDEITDIIIGVEDIIVKTDEANAATPVTEEQLLHVINAKYYGEQRENALSLVDVLIEGQEQYHVNALFVLAFVQQETSMGTADTDYVNEDNNWASWNLGTKYSSPQENVRTAIRGIATGSYYFTQGKYTIKEIGLTYCPNTDKYPTQGDGWVKNVTSTVKKMYSLLGANIEDNTSGNPSGDIEEGFGVSESGDGYSKVYVTANGRRFKEYKQFLGSYAYSPFAGGTMKSSGCSATSVAVVLSGYGIDATPEDIRKLGNSGGIPVAGTLQDYGLTAVDTGRPVTVEELLNHLNTGNVAIINAGHGYWSNSSGHYFVALEAKGNQVYVSNVGDNQDTGWYPVDKVLEDNKKVIYVSE